MITPAGISRALADRIGALVLDLLPGGYREGHEWRIGSVAGEAGSSLGVHLTGRKAGIWCDFATGEKGDALDLVRASLDTDLTEAVAWSRSWLGIRGWDAALPAQSSPVSALKRSELEDPDRWRWPWLKARPIAGSLAQTYLAARRLHFDDAEGRVLRFTHRRARKNPVTEELEHHPALLCVLSDAKSGEQCGLINIYLKPDGSDRLRDAKGKTVAGRSRGAVVMLSDFDEPTMGLSLCEGVETGIAVFQSGQRPVWACGAAGKLATFPVLGGIEGLTIAADHDEPGLRAAEELANKWRAADSEVLIAAPSAGDWCDHP